MWILTEAPRGSNFYEAQSQTGNKALIAMHDYANAGGRICTWSRFWSGTGNAAMRR